ncbi:hypothetical protein B0H14DRAFT_3174080 [Mycena olivaceomarginata]|nr:hypothetical protein B0H14DRAFT_3174080 [Mycena olivaceomarginata]
MHLWHILGPQELVVAGADERMKDCVLPQCCHGAPQFLSWTALHSSHKFTNTSGFPQFASSKLLVLVLPPDLVWPHPSPVTTALTIYPSSLRCPSSSGEDDNDHVKFDDSLHPDEEEEDDKGGKR